MDHGGEQGRYADHAARDGCRRQPIHDPNAAVLSPTVIAKDLAAHDRRNECADFGCGHLSPAKPVYPVCVPLQDWRVREVDVEASPAHPALTHYEILEVDATHHRTMVEKRIGQELLVPGECVVPVGKVAHPRDLTSIYPIEPGVGAEPSEHRARRTEAMHAVMSSDTVPKLPKID